MKAGWEIKPLGEAFQTVTGNTPPKSNKAYYGSDVPLIKPPELLDVEIGDVADGLTVAGAEVARIAPEGSVLVSCIGNLGKIGTTTKPSAFNQQINAIYPDLEIAVPQFMHYQALSPKFKEQLESLAKGTTVPIVNKSRFNSISVALPPLEEQRRIVAVLDEAFEGLNRARENTETNLTNARELFEASILEVFGGFCDLPSMQCLNDLSELIVDCEHKTAPLSEQGYPSIRTPNIGAGYLILEDVNRVDEETYQLWTRRAKPKAGDLILAREAPAGNVGLVPEGETVCLGQRTVLIRPKNMVHPQFLVDYLMHPTVQRRLLSKSTGATVKHINMRDIRGLSLPEWPSKDYQVDISTKVSGLRESYLTIIKGFKSKIIDLEDLRQSLLQKAFAGELT